MLWVLWPVLALSGMNPGGRTAVEVAREEGAPAQGVGPATHSGPDQGVRRAGAWDSHPCPGDCSNLNRWHSVLL